MRRALVAFVTFVGGAYFLFEFMIPAQAPAWLGGFDNPLTPHLQLATNLVIILSTAAFLLGPINLVRHNLSILWRKRPGWLQAIIFLVFLAVGISVQIANDVSRQPDAGAAAAAAETPMGVQVYQLFFFGLVLAFGAASIALLAVYLVSAAFRSFRLQNLDSGVMMITATIVLIGLAPLGDVLFGDWPRWLQPNAWAQWVLEVPNTAVQRAVAIGVCAGAFAVGTRHWLSIGTRSE